MTPGGVVENWVSDLSLKVGTPDVTWQIVTGLGQATNRCTINALCSVAGALINHISWPDGVADGSGIDYEPAVLDALRARPLP